MSSDKKIEIQILSQPGAERKVIKRATVVAREMGFPDDKIEDLKTSIAEACINAIEHGNKFDASMKVCITMTIKESHLKVEIEDEGKEFGTIKTPNIEAKIEGKEDPRGWGIFLMNNLMDDVTFNHKPMGGNVVTMKLRLDNRAIRD